jgi:predicted SAM-dependent methyltransferase
MLVEKVQGEVDHCRHRLMKYCRGQGLDLGCGASKIRTDAIGVDLYHPTADMNVDARNLECYPAGLFDYVFSSHLLEEIDNTEATLREWLRILKPGGNLVLYQVDKNKYYPFEDPRCNRAHKHHYVKEELWAILEKMGGVELLHTQEPVGHEWSFELVVRKLGGDVIGMNGEGISLLIPTLNRPPNMDRFAMSVNNTSKCPEGVELLFGIHEEDTGSIQKAEELKSKCKISIRYEIIKRFPDGKINLSFLWNQLYNKASNPILGYFGDDVIFWTPDWDAEVRKEFSIDKTIMVSTNDVHVQKGKQATLFFTHKTVHDYFKVYLDERFRRWYMDTYWDIIYRTAGKMHYREDLVCEHLHPDKFPDKADQVYKNMEYFKDSDSVLWHTPEIQQDIKNKAHELSTLKFDSNSPEKISARKILYSFGTIQRFTPALRALGDSALASAHVDKIIRFSENDISPEFYKENEAQFKASRGFGYWIWKAYFINKLLNIANSGDILFYIDASNEVIKDLTPLYEQCLKDEKGIILFDNRDGEPTGNVWKNNLWTKSDCFNLMELREDKYIFGNQINASYILFRKTDFSVDFFKTYLNYCKNNNIISDDPNITEDFNKDFRDHRHDQSILSLLAIKQGVTVLRDPSQWGGPDNYFSHNRTRYYIPPTGINP